jgi:hypothetical protein
MGEGHKGIWDQARLAPGSGRAEAACQLGPSVLQLAGCPSQQVMETSERKTKIWVG